MHSGHEAVAPREARPPTLGKCVVGLRDTDLSGGANHPPARYGAARWGVAVQAVPDRLRMAAFTRPKKAGRNPIADTLVLDREG